MKAKVLNALCKKAYNRLNRTREWATSSSYSSFTSPLHRATSEIDLTTNTYVRNANNTSDVSNLGRDSRYDVHPLVRESAVARLLVEGRLPASSAPITIPKQEKPSQAASPSLSYYAEPDASSSPRCETLETVGMELGPETSASPVHHNNGQVSASSLREQEANSLYIHQTLKQEMAFLTDAARVQSGMGQIWKCTFCPYTAQTSAVLFNHYQFHLQLLASPSSRAHVEFMTAYRRGRRSDPEKMSLLSVPETNVCRSMPCSSSKASLPRTSSQTLNQSFPGLDPKVDKAAVLRQLLIAQKHQQLQKEQQRQQQQSRREKDGSESVQNAASGFLRSFVQAVMQKGDKKGENVSTSSIYESLVNGNKNTTGNNSVMECSPPKKVKMDENNDNDVKQANSSIAPETLSSIDNSNHWNYPIDMTVGKSPVKLEPMDILSPNTITSQSSLSSTSFQVDGSPSSGCVSPRSTASSSPCSDKVSVGSAGDDTILMNSTPETGLYDTSSFKQRDGESLVQDRKRSIDKSQPPTPSAKKCNGSFAPRKMLIARSRRTHRSSSMESVSSLDSTSCSGSLPTKSISSASTWQTNETFPQIESSESSLSSSVQNKLAMDMSTQCSLLVPADGSDVQNETEAASSSSQSQGVVNHRDHAEDGPSHTQCQFCNIQFGDEVLHSIHMGCHNHTEPFVCNICGKDCYNKYGFYTHIMRGHNS